MHTKFHFLLFIPMFICYSALISFGQQLRSGDKKIVVTETVDTIARFDTVTYIETIIIQVYQDTMIFHNVNKVELRKQKRPYKDIPQIRDMGILERNQAVRDTMIFINPDNQEMIIIPSKGG